jgi:16S rRNA (cytidine1402-2'-O)-methyltransferase
LKDFSITFGESRRIALCRELTKLNEEVLRMTLGEALSYYEEREPRGEYVLVVEGASEASTLNATEEVDIPTHVKRYMNAGMSKMDAIKQTAKDRGVHKNEIYQVMLGEKE